MVQAGYGIHWGAQLICIDALWLAAEPIAMRASAEQLRARVMQVFGSAQAQHRYLVANTWASRITLLVHDGFGVRCGRAAPERRPLRLATPRAETGGSLFDRPRHARDVVLDKKRVDKGHRQ